ncbi:hypothetical protein [Plantactinospora sp. B5E13]|uniref:hypothetical protein n=1 Tax=Plantactinospora sp. B5E13 TaxID=3153758 RepID=UPI00325F76BD
MTGGQFREVDLDLLADYVGGALDGTPDEAEVARLVTQAPDWAAAYAALTGGLDAVRLDLASLASPPEPMPAVVVDHIEAALDRAALDHPAAQTIDAGWADDAAQPGDAVTQPGDAEDAGADAGTVGADDGTAAGTAGDAESDEPSPSTLAADRKRDDTSVPGRAGRRLSGVPVQTRTGPSPATRGPGRRRRWVRRAAGPVVLAAVVVGFAGFAISRLGTVSGSDEQATGTAYSTTRDNAEAAPLLGSGSPPTMPGPGAERVLATGSNYTSNTLAGNVEDLARDPFSRAATKAPATSRGTQQDTTDGSTGGPVEQESRATVAAPVPVPGLERLADPSVLARCLDAVAATHARGPVTVDLVDYALFEGRAALVVVFTDQSGARWAWATGPECGTSPTEADVTYQTRVG